MEDKKKWWRWLEWVEMIWHWTQSDPELKYNWAIANYWTVEDWLYEIFEEDMKELWATIKEKERDSVFNHWLKDNFYIVQDIFAQIEENNIL